VTVDLSSAPIQERFNHLLAVLSSSRFLTMQGLGNEVPFFICPFSPEEAVAMERTRQNLIHQLNQRQITVLDVNLYDLAVQLLKERGIWDQVIEIEPTVSKAELLELLQGVLDPENHLVPSIGAMLRAERPSILFLSGVGEVFPFIRSHSVLNNLQSTATDQPTVLFFPGEYTQSLESGASLDLFGRMNDDRYYRAFNIYHCET
jgi:hypothetical protein